MAFDKRYDYEVVTLGFNIWTGKAKEDYLKIINEYGDRGWRFVCFAPAAARPKGAKGTEMIFEKEINE